MGPSVVALTLGGDGVYLAAAGHKGIIPGFPAEVVDTTGAGDSFFGGFLSQYAASGKQPGEVGWEEWERFARFGNATAALCVQKRGGIPAIPRREEVERLVQ